MNIIVYTASPNTDGLTAACGEAAALGARKAGATVKIVDLNKSGIGMCQACGRGYGTCWTEHECQVKDGFQAVHHELLQADAFVLVTPVYWGEFSESAKAFTDRLRRCEATRWEQSGLKNMKAVGVAAAGGSGRGTITCLLAFQQFCQHVHADVFDMISISQKSRRYKLDTIYQCLYDLTASSQKSDGE